MVGHHARKALRDSPDDNRVGRGGLGHGLSLEGDDAGYNAGPRRTLPRASRTRVGFATYRLCRRVRRYLDLAALDLVGVSVDGVLDVLREEVARGRVADPVLGQVVGLVARE